MLRLWLILSYFVSKVAKTWMHTWNSYPSPAIAQIWLSKGYTIYQHRCAECGETYWSARETGGCRRHLGCYLAYQKWLREVAVGTQG